MNRTTANYDEPWKEALTEYFEAFFWTLRQKNVLLTNSIKFGYSVEKKSGF
jgi:hypothetical protein